MRWQRADDATVRAESDRNPIWNSLGRKEFAGVDQRTAGKPCSRAQQLLGPIALWDSLLPALLILPHVVCVLACRLDFSAHRKQRELQSPASVRTCVCVCGGGAQPPHLDSRVGRREKAVPESRQTRRWTCASLAYQDRVLSLCEIKVEACLVWHRSSRIYRQHYRPIQG